jgi:hypothetical protein
MAKISRKAGTTSHILEIFLQDSSKTTGDGLTGLLFSTAGLTCYYKRNRDTASVAVTLADITTLGTYASGGLKAVDGTHMPGVMEFHPPDAALAAGSGTVTFFFQGATNLAQTPQEVELTATDNQDAVRGGMTALPNVNAGASGGLPTGDASGRVTGAANLLDAIAVTDPGAPASHTTLSKRVNALWRAIYGKATMTATQQKWYADDGSTVNATSSVSDDGTTQTRGAAS